MSLFTRETAEDIRGQKLVEDFLDQLNILHSKDFQPDKEIEEMLLKQKVYQIALMDIERIHEDIPTFSPSGASKCPRELYYKLTGVQEENTRQPYHYRWTRNSTAVHEAIQRDLLYAEKFVSNPSFTVKKVDREYILPAWEEQLKTERIFKGFKVRGMMDGVLQYKDGSTIGFEFKTKSNTLGQVGYYKMKEPTPYHRLQCVAYSILFGMDEFIICYESVVKDGWSKGKEAKPDIRAFYLKITDDERFDLLTKFKEVAMAVDRREEPEGDCDKCLFCGYKYKCQNKGECQ